MPHGPQLHWELGFTTGCSGGEGGGLSQYMGETWGEGGEGGGGLKTALKKKR